PPAVLDYEAARDTGILQRLVSGGKLVAFHEVDPKEFGPQDGTAAYLLEHPRLSFISHPYEWSFSLLRDAALFHLDLHLELLSSGFTLSDASAYNVVFDGPWPIFFVHLSIRPYPEGDFWIVHCQFCEQFLTPLLLRVLFGATHVPWYRGNLEGIPVGGLAKRQTVRHKLSW